MKASTARLWAADFDRLAAALLAAGAVKTLPDGSQYVDASVLPANRIGWTIASAYEASRQYGYANGLL